jgi:HK97 family phage portal protein
MTTYVLSNGKNISLADLSANAIATTSGAPNYARWIASTAAYDSIYRHSPATRAVVDFIARNLAQVTAKVWRRNGDDDRESLYEHAMAQTLREPNPATTRYAFMYALAADLLIYDESTSLIAQNGDDMMLARVPPAAVNIEGGTLTAIEKFTINLDNQSKPVSPDKVFYVHGYAPDRIHRGLAPLETLRQLIDEESAATATRRSQWEQGMAIPGYLKRPSSAPPWSNQAKEGFQADFAQRFAGPNNAGKVPILEDDMDFNASGFSPEQAQYVEARRLTREDVARAYHLPLSVAGLIDAPMGSTKALHEQLYQDCLGPWLIMLREELNRQLVPRFSDSENVYVEFDLQSKLAGSFEETATILVSAIGRPYMTPNEGRVRQGFDRSDDPTADRLSIPLNVMIAGPGDGSTPDVVPPTLTGAEGGTASHMLEAKAKAVSGTQMARMRDRHAKRYEAQLNEFFDRQKRTVASDQGKFDVRRWDADLFGDLLPMHVATTTAAGDLVAAGLAHEFDPAMTQRYLRKAAATDARGINRTTRDRMNAAIANGADAKDAFDTTTAYRAGLLAVTYATQYGMFGSHEAADQGGARYKTWVVTSDQSRHPELDGERVKLGGLFSNGASYPGDPAAGDEESAGCRCVVEYS